jgi:CubicO group peptidase (beta-lactamase class C family)
MDHEKLPFKSISKAENSTNYFLAEKDNYTSTTNWLDTQLVNTQTNAYLIIKNDSIIYEKYFNGYDKSTLLPSFSVAKSYVATLTTIAKEEGKISSLHEPITNYIPQLLKNDIRFKNITIQNLLDMRSGIKWNEGSYNLNDDAIKMGFRPNMLPYVYKLKIDTEPKKDSAYKSINTLLLSMIIEKATGKDFIEYFEEKIWKPLGTEYGATWNTDKKGFVIAFGGLNATARDFAKLGSLYLHEGAFNNKQLLTKEWVNASISKDSMAAYKGYRNQFWGLSETNTYEDSLTAISKNEGQVKSYKTKDGIKKFYTRPYTNRFQAEGILGQFVLVIPEKNMVIVRLGHYWSHKKYYAEGFMDATWRKF